jgi:hypothetical protein
MRGSRVVVVTMAAMAPTAEGQNGGSLVAKITTRGVNFNSFFERRDSLLSRRTDSKAQVEKQPPVEQKTHPASPSLLLPPSPSFSLLLPPSPSFSLPNTTWSNLVRRIFPTLCHKFYIYLRKLRWKNNHPWNRSHTKVERYTWLQKNLHNFYRPLDRPSTDNVYTPKNKINIEKIKY